MDKIIKDDEWRDKLMTLEEEMNYQKEYFFEKGTEKTTKELISNLMASTGMSLEQAMDALMIKGKDREKVKGLKNE